MIVKSTCTIRKISRLAEDIILAEIYAPELSKEAVPGQFLHIKCGEADMLRRPISICNNENDVLTIVFQVKGKGTEWLAKRKEGDELDILGPLGNGFRIPQSGKTIIVGGGIGVPPMLLTAKACPGETAAILGFRDKSRVILKDEFDKVCSSVCITTDDGSFGTAGTAAVPLEELLKTGEYKSVLACGPKVMLKSVYEICVKYSADCQVSLEERMGCGIGACLVCACKIQKDGHEHMSHVCKDGPVFNASEVVW